MFNICLFLLLSISLPLITGVDRGNFKTCQQSSFCRRCRAVEPGKTPYYLDLNTLRIDEHSVEAQLVNMENGVIFTFQLIALRNETFRLRIRELTPLNPRYEVQHALVGEPELNPIELLERTAEYVSIKSGENIAKVSSKPFHVEFYSGDTLITSVNARGLLKFEHTRPKPERKEGENGDNEADNQPPSDDITDPGAWEENFKSSHDSKPHGPQAVALDFSFFDAHYAYGIPEHADSFALKSTKSSDPYRLYNLDVFEYELHNPMSLYGSVPFLVAHGVSHTTGVLWLNAAETWVDIQSTSDQNVVSSIVNLVSGSSNSPQVDAHFISESGIIDTFIMLGPKPMDVFRQYIKLTGPAPLPQYFALGYHQSRWNYNDQDDVRNVHAKFDEYDLPMDVMWLDIEHTDNRKYFTWDKIKFSDPITMVNNLTAKGRKLVVIVDPHVKRESGYFLHDDAEHNGFYVKNKDGNIYEGWCWPGSSSYLDMFNPAAQEYYSSRYLFDNYHGTTQDVYLWNDMNEPSVFNGPEITMPKDNIHYGDWEHRDIHNINGFMFTMGTYNGLLKRSNNGLRPFILTRSFFSGSQRHAAMWTGDNTADWGHLRITIPMCLSVSIAGISFCGADVGGFFKNPDKELFIRWYQAGAFQPFFRAHSHIDTKRREPWLFDDEALLLVREALRKRYSYLPFWYTLFYEHERFGAPVMRPLWTDFPEDVNTFRLDDEYLLGNALLVHPVTDPGATTVNVYLPGPNTFWYNTETFQKFVGNTNLQVNVDLHSIPVFQKGGTIIPKKERIRRSSVLTYDDPFTLVITLDSNQSASGTLYIDDGESFDYRKGKYLYISLTFDGKQLTARLLDDAQFMTKAWLERVVIIGLKQGYGKAQVESRSLGKVSLDVSYHTPSHALVVRKPGVSMAEDWVVELV